MSRPVIALLVSFALLLFPPAGKAEVPESFADIHYLIAKVPDLETIPSDLPVMSSPSARDRAVTYGKIISSAAKYFEQKLGWTMPVRMLVLDSEDWDRISDIPYPAPHIRNTEKLILMPDSLVAFPGFDTWGFEDVSLNAVLTVHELGHGLAHRNGLNVSDTDRSITEIIANILMAGFIYDEMPEMKRLLEGVPSGFTPTENYQLSDFDYFYVSLGLRNYAYFQFMFAKAAGHMVRSKALPELMPAMVKAFETGAYFLPSANLAKLDAIVPGTSANLDGLMGYSLVKETAMVACRNMLPENVEDNSALLFVENRGTRPIRLRDTAWEKRQEEINIAIAKMIGEEPRKVEPEFFSIPPERWTDLRVVPGQELVVEGEGCIRVDANPIRFVNRN